MDMSGDQQTPAASFPERTPFSNEHEVGWASDKVRTFWRQEKSLIPPKIQMPDCPTRRTYKSIAGKFNAAYNTSP
jgi:hypothetical protein